MRRVIRDIGIPDHHVGLAYEIWAPLLDEGANAGHIPDDKKQGWLQKVARISVDEAYRHAFERWKRSFAEKNIRILKLRSRLLVGHGNPAPTEVGLTVHHTWGVPIIPGSALKGLCAHYLETVYGPEEPTAEPWKDEERGPLQGVLRQGSRIKAGPGEIYRRLFGAPDTAQDRQYREMGYPAGASRGEVVFHDALYVPGSSSGDRPYAVDVLTPHQRGYYGTDAGSDGDGKNTWPNDYEDPVPVNFLTVRPGACFLLALSGPEDLVELARFLLLAALKEWGVGGKTAAGYGVLEEVEEKECRAKSSKDRKEKQREEWRPEPGRRAWRRDEEEHVVIKALKRGGAEIQYEDDDSYVDWVPLDLLQAPRK